MLVVLIKIVAYICGGGCDDDGEVVEVVVVMVILVVLIILCVL